MTSRNRYQLRFTKGGDLRYLGHRDLLRTLERLFRRAGLQLAMTEGYHPKPRLSFPLALAVGIAGIDEVVELELTEELTADGLLARLSARCPPGLEFTSAELLSPGMKNAPVKSVSYELPVPADREEALQQQIAELLESPSYLIHRPGRAKPIDLRPLLLELALHGRLLRITLETPREVQVRPREVLAAVGLNDLESLGGRLVRTSVNLATQCEVDERGAKHSSDLRPHNIQPRKENHEARNADQRGAAGGVPDCDRRRRNP